MTSRIVTPGGKGEPIVCTAQDALRTFWATGLEILAVGDFLVRKPKLS